MAQCYQLSWATVKKWKTREEIEDYSSRPHRLRTDLTPPQEDIFFALEGEIPDLYPMKIYRVLSRYDLSRLPDDFKTMERSYIYTAIDWVAKIAFIMIGRSKTKETDARFLKEVLAFFPYQIHYLLTDNGFEFSYKALPKGKKTKKVHPFDQICRENKILPVAFTKKIAPVVGLRNRIVHRCEALDKKLFLKTFRKNYPDFAKYLRFIYKYLQKRTCNH